MIEGTIIARLHERRDPAAVNAQRSRGPLPTIEEFAHVITVAANGRDLRDTVYVGGEDHLVRPA